MCGEQPAHPATPDRTQGDEESRQRSADPDVICRLPQAASARTPLCKNAWPASTVPRAGVTTMHCVWLI